MALPSFSYSSSSSSVSIDLYEVAQRGTPFSVLRDSFVVAAEHKRSSDWETTFGTGRDPAQKLRVQAL